MIDVAPRVQILTEESMKAGGIAEDLLRTTPSVGQREGQRIVVGAWSGAARPCCSPGPVSQQPEVEVLRVGGGIPRVVCEVFGIS